MDHESKQLLEISHFSISSPAGEILILMHKYDHISQFPAHNFPQISMTEMFMLAFD